MDPEKLIRLVKDRPPLWDLREKTYHYRDLQKKLWLEVAEEMGTRVDDVKKRWHGLRDVFRREYNKHQESKSGDEASGECTITWPYFEDMLFLKDSIEMRKYNKYVTSMKKELKAEEFPQCEVDFSDNSSEPTFEYKGAWEQDNSQPSMAQSGAMDPPPTTRKRQKLVDPTRADEYPQMEKVETPVTNEWDYDYQYLVSLLPFLRNVPDHRKLTIRQKLQQVFLDEETEQNALKLSQVPSSSSFGSGGS